MGPLVSSHYLKGHFCYLGNFKARLSQWYVWTGGHHLSITRSGGPNSEHAEGFLIMKVKTCNLNYAKG